MSRLAEVQAIRDSRPRHRRLRFNSSLVAQFLGLGEVPAQILDVAGVCKFLRLERAAIEELIKIGLPHSDINPRSIREKN